MASTGRPLLSNDLEEVNDPISKEMQGMSCQGAKKSMCKGPEVECSRISEQAGLNPNEGRRAVGSHVGVLAFPGWPSGR